MKILSQASELRELGGPICVAIGVFDGVHRGHQRVIGQTLADARQFGARAVGITFDRHPNVVVAPEHTPPLISSLPQKLRLIQGLGLEALWMIAFDRPFSEQTGEEFIRRLARNTGRLRGVCVGQTFMFGRQRSGDLALLQSLGEGLGFETRGLPAVDWEGLPISSTRIREAIQAGRWAAVQAMLGREYRLSGPVVAGEGLGRELGAPTANLDTSGLALPPKGVYACTAFLGEAPCPAVVNIGVRPTVTAGLCPPRVEAHLLDFNGDLRGKELELAFVTKLREEERFPSLEALKGQIQRDCLAARQALAAQSSGG